MEYIQRNTIVTSTEEYNLLTAAVKEKGGHIVHAFTLRDQGAGISVQYMIPVEREETSE